MRRNRGYMIPLDIAFYALYITPFLPYKPTIVDYKSPPCQRTLS
jgi:hypothetical protein